jgi:hypothetical protein
VARLDAQEVSGLASHRTHRVETAPAAPILNAETGPRIAVTHSDWRSDLLDCSTFGYVTVTPELRLVVSDRRRGEFENGRTYYALHGAQVTVPRALLRPDPVPAAVAQQTRVPRVNLPRLLLQRDSSRRPVLPSRHLRLSKEVVWHRLPKAPRDGDRSASLM